MIVELILASCFAQQPLPPAPPSDAVPPGSTPAPTPVLPPSADVTPAIQPPPTPDVLPRPRTPVPPRVARAAQAVPAASAAPPGVPQGQHAPVAVPARRAGQGSGDYYAPTMGGMGGMGGAEVAAIYGMGRRPMDPKEAELERKARETAGTMLREQDPAKKAQIKTSLQALVAEQFQIRQQRRAEEVKRLEDEVKRLRDALEKREKSRDAIIGRRIAELTGDDDLGF